MTTDQEKREPMSEERLEECRRLVVDAIRLPQVSGYMPDKLEVAASDLLTEVLLLRAQLAEVEGHSWLDQYKREAAAHDETADRLRDTIDRLRARLAEVTAELRMATGEAGHHLIESEKQRKRAEAAEQQLREVREKRDEWMRRWKLHDQKVAELRGHLRSHAEHVGGLKDGETLGDAIRGVVAERDALVKEREEIATDLMVEPQDVQEVVGQLVAEGAEAVKERDAATKRAEEAEANAEKQKRLKLKAWDELTEMERIACALCRVRFTKS